MHNEYLSILVQFDASLNSFEFHGHHFSLQCNCFWCRRVIKEDEMPPGRVFARRWTDQQGLGAPSLVASRKIVFSQRFEWIAAAIMLGNSLLVGIEAEFTLNNLSAVP